MRNEPFFIKATGTQTPDVINEMQPYEHPFYELINFEICNHATTEGARFEL